MWWNKASREDGGGERRGERHTERHAGMGETGKGRETHRETEKGSEKHRETHTYTQGREETGESHSSLEGMPN